MKNLKELRIYYRLEDTNSVIETINKDLADSRCQLDSLLRLHLFIYPNMTLYRNLDDNHLVYDSTFWRTYFQATFPNLKEFSISKGKYF